MLMYLFLLLWHSFCPFYALHLSRFNLLAVAHSYFFFFFNFVFSLEELSRSNRAFSISWKYFLKFTCPILSFGGVFYFFTFSNLDVIKICDAIGGMCKYSVFCRLPWPSGIVTIGMGIRPSGVEDFTSCIVYRYIVQFFNTFYLQQYLCIFYEVIKWITLHTSVFAHTFSCPKSFLTLVNMVKK